MSESDLKYLVFSGIKQSHPQIKQLIDENYMNPTHQLIGFTDDINRFFVKHDTDLNIYNRFTSLPSSIGAVIISFNNMRDRMNHQLISKDIYKFCQIPMAKYHLCIDHKFCKALYFDMIDIKKHFNAQYIEIRYVFKDAQFERFEDKYYSMISKILSKSPLLHTFKYELQYKRFFIKLSKTTSNSYNGYHGHILEWIDKIKNNSNSHKNVFNGITKLIYIPSQFRMDCRWDTPSKWRNQYDLFCHYLPNLTSFSMPTIRSYLPLGSGDVNKGYEDDDCEWNIFKKPAFHNKLQQIECNMVPIKIASWWDIKHINIKNHPLSHLDKFRNLKLLKLTLPIFTNCHNYYGSLIISNILSKVTTKCVNLQEISLEFVMDYNEYFNINSDIYSAVIRGNEYDSVIDNICKFILSHSPNINKYELITNQIINNNKINAINHLIGFYDRLEILHTDLTSIVVTGIRMISLKKLQIRFYDENDKIISKYKDLNGFPNLESFECIYVNKTNEKWKNLNVNIKDFINYISQQKEIKKLKYIGIYHDIQENKNRKKKRKSTQYFDLRQCGNDSSLEICKSIISLTTNNNNFELKSVELKPVALKQKELEYLYFWFKHGNGGIDITNYMRKPQTVLTDLYCSQ